MAEEMEIHQPFTERRDQGAIIFLLQVVHDKIEKIAEKLTAHVHELR